MSSSSTSDSTVGLQSLAALPPPPLPPPPAMLFTLSPNMARMSLSGGPVLPDAVVRGQGCARIGRGGRLIFDRTNALTYDELSTASPGGDDGVSVKLLLLSAPSLGSIGRVACGPLIFQAIMHQQRWG